MNPSTLPAPILAVYLRWRRLGRMYARLYLESRGDPEARHTTRRYRVQGRRWHGCARRLALHGIPASAWTRKETYAQNSVDTEGERG